MILLICASDEGQREKRPSLTAFVVGLFFTPSTRLKFKASVAYSAFSGPEKPKSGVRLGINVMFPEINAVGLCNLGHDSCETGDAQVHYVCQGAIRTGTLCSLSKIASTSLSTEKKNLSRMHGR